jgi:hypothetical protein
MTPDILSGITHLDVHFFLLAISYVLLGPFLPFDHHGGRIGRKVIDEYRVKGVWCWLVQAVPEKERGPLDS